MLIIETLGATGYESFTIAQKRLSVAQKWHMNTSFVKSRNILYLILFAAHFNFAKIVPTLTLSQWSSSGNPVAIQCARNLEPSVHWNATGEMPVCFQWSSSGLPVAFQWSSSVFQLCKLTLDRHWDTTGCKHQPVWFQWHPSVLVAPVVFQCVPIMQINTGSPLEHHWVLASASVVPVASQCTCGSSGLPVRSVQWYPSVLTESGLEVIGSGHFPACDP